MGESESRWRLRIVITAACVAIVSLLGIGFYPTLRERYASLACRGPVADFDTCRACCADHSMSMSQTAGVPGELDCRCFITSRDSVLARPLTGATKAGPVGDVVRDDSDLGLACERPPDCRGGCMRFDNRGELVLRQSDAGTLRCTRSCEGGCPTGFHCSTLEVMVRGGAPQTIAACGPDP